MKAANIIVTDQGFRVSGQIRFDNVVETAQLGEAQIELATQPNIEIDLTDIAYDDTACIPLLTAWMRCCKRFNRAITFTVPEDLQNIIDLCHLNTIIKTTQARSTT